MPLFWSVFRSLAASFRGSSSTGTMVTLAVARVSMNQSRTTLERNGWNIRATTTELAGEPLLLQPDPTHDAEGRVGPAVGATRTTPRLSSRGTSRSKPTASKREPSGSLTLAARVPTTVRRWLAICWAPSQTATGPGGGAPKRTWRTLARTDVAARRRHVRQRDHEGDEPPDGPRHQPRQPAADNDRGEDEAVGAGAWFPRRGGRGWLRLAQELDPPARDGSRPPEGRCHRSIPTRYGASIGGGGSAARRWGPLISVLVQPGGARGSLAPVYAAARHGRGGVP
jgi:hypothetical protein